MKTWAVCYGPSFRYGEAPDAKVAIRCAFQAPEGTVTVVPFPDDPEAMTPYPIKKFLTWVYLRHLSRSGMRATELEAEVDQEILKVC